MFLKPVKKKLVSWLGPRFAYWTMRMLGWTMRLQVVNPETPRSYWERGIPFIVAFWHGRLLMMVHAYEGNGMGFLVSSHRDGQVVAMALQRFGLHPIMGSTSWKSFSGLKKMIKALQNGLDIAIVPDGPRGPRQQAQMGVVELSKLTGRPMIPISFSASKKIIFNTWDRFLLPYPFSRGVFIWGEAIHVDHQGDRSHLEEKRRLLEKRLNELTEEADRYFETRVQKSKFQP